MYIGSNILINNFNTFALVYGHANGSVELGLKYKISHKYLRSPK